MKVILSADVKNVGKKGEIVELNDGYARNCIIKKKLGVEATGKSLNDLKLKNAHDEKVAAEKLEEAKVLAKKIEESRIDLSLKVGNNGKPFGAISSKEIAEASAKQLGIELDKKKISLKDSIKTLGVTEVTVKVHPQVSAKLKVFVTEEK